MRLHRSSFVGGSSAVSSSSRSVLSTSDFTYLGSAFVPLDTTGVRFGYSYGTSITTRRIGGDLHVFMSMAHAGEPVVGKVCEMVYEGVGQRMSVYKAWGDIFGDKRTITDVNGVHQFGLNWDGEKLLWSFGPYYSDEHSRTIGATTFNGTSSHSSYGSWRTQCHAKQSNGFMLNIPSDKQSLFGGHTHMIGGISTSINVLNTWGHSLNSFSSANLLSNAADSVSDTGDVSIPTTEIMTANLSNKMLRDPTWQKCTKTLTGSGYTCDSPTLEDPVGVVSDIDMANGAAWIQNTTKHGIVFCSVMVDRINDPAFRTAHYNGGNLPHTWYSTEGDPCCHGHTALIPGTGPHTPSLVPQIWIYDPDDLSDSGLTPIQRANNPVHKHKHLWEMTLGHPNEIPKTMDYYYYTGCAYDPVDRLLFVAISQQDTFSQFEDIPIVHVFQVAA